MPPAGPRGRHCRAGIVAYLLTMGNITALLLLAAGAVAGALFWMLRPVASSRFLALALAIAFVAISGVVITLW